jgi:CO/xanthine dehydrogenase FAD-binding subunit
MKPSVFAYQDPSSLEEALELLHRYGADAKVLAGGQSLVPLLNFRLSSPAALIDLNRITALAYIRQEGEELRIGAMTRQRTIEFSPLVRERLPLLHEATTLIGHLPIRTRGTLGGSLSHADPAAEYPAVATALEAELVLQNAHSTRVLRAEKFFVSYLTTALAPDEVVVEVRFSLPVSTSGWAFAEFAQRHGDFALAGVAAVLDANGEQCRLARLATAGVGPTPLRLRAVEHLLEQDGLTEQSIEAAAERAAELVEPSNDLHASADYRRHLVRVLTRKALKRAATRSREKQQ